MLRNYSAAGGLALLFSLFSMSGMPAETTRPTEPITLRVQGLPNPVSNDARSIAGRRVISEFHRQHPHIRLVAAEGLQIPNMVTESMTVMMVLGGIAPDVLRMNFRSIDTFVRQGMVAPLDEFVAEAPHVREQIPPAIRPVVERAAPAGGGGKHLYGLPAEVMVMGLFYNKEVFRQAGLPDRVPMDWEEMAGFSRQVKSLGEGYYGLTLLSGADASWNLMSFLWSAGGEAVAEVSPDEWRAVFHSPGAVEAYLYYYRLVEGEKSALRIPKGGERTFDQDKIGMRFGYVGDVVDDNMEKWGFGPVPVGPTGLRGSEINASIYGIFSGIADPQVKQAAFAYIRFVTGEEAEKIMVKTYVELGLASAMNPVLLRKYGLEDWLIMVPPGLEESIGLAMAEGKPEPYGKNCNLVYAEMSRPLDRILFSKEIAAAWKAGNGTEARRLASIILDEAVVKTNERMLAHVEPEEMSKRRMVAAVAVALVALAFGWVVRYVFKAFSQSADLMSRPVRGRSILPWLFLIPALALIFLWSYLPVARGTVLAFLDFNILLKSSFVGLDNFANALFDRTFWNALVATLHYAAWTLTLGFFTPVVLAYILHLIPKHKVIFRTLYYLPSVISGTAVFFLWFELFSANGFFNQLLRLIGVPATRAWMDDPSLAMLTCILPSVWAGAGPGCLIYLAALKTVPEEQFEAAELDGAGFLDKTRHIIFPALKMLLIMNFVGAVAAAFHSSSNILIMTGGGPNGATEVMSLFIFFEAFTRLRFGPATAVAWIVGSLLVGVTIIQLKRLSRMEFKTTK
jgi:ABC-type sugar transport system permease subunit/ABC-type glycerol-3-phosphate transport system substrate-binding protein